MSFNYGREEKKWRLWKEAEEKELRGLGVDEDTIEKLCCIYRKIKSRAIFLSFCNEKVGMIFNLTICAMYGNIPMVEGHFKQRHISKGHCVKSLAQNNVV